jgi:N-acetylmuramoyl-L-alanine amidase
MLGLRDVGAVGSMGGKKYYERTVAVELARRIINILETKKELKKCLIQGVGVETEANISRKMKYVNMVMSENRFTPSRCLGVSIHLNAVSSSAPRGFEVWYQKNNRPRAFAEFIVRAWKKYDVIPLRPTALLPTSRHRFGKLYIDDTLCPFVLLEVGFISSVMDLKAVLENLDRSAEAIAHGIMEYIRSLS